MTTKYVVTCWAPPASLEIKSGQIVEVQGYRKGHNIRANSIVNITKEGPRCLCGMPKPLAALGEKATVEGKVSNVQQSSDFIQFDLETTKYVVTCWGPPASLEIKSGQIVEVQGYRRGHNIKADSIVNVTEEGPRCLCQPPKPLVAFGEKVTVEGKASNIQLSSNFVQFDLETE